MLKAKEDLRQFLKENKAEIIGVLCAISIIAMHSKHHDKKVIKKFMDGAMLKIDLSHGLTPPDIYLSGKTGGQFLIKDVFYLLD